MRAQSLRLYLSHTSADNCRPQVVPCTSDLPPADLVPTIPTSRLSDLLAWLTELREALYLCLLVSWIEEMHMDSTGRGTELPDLSGSVALQKPTCAELCGNSPTLSI
jgi:hypothetical protein